MGKIFSVEFLIQSIPQIAVYLPITLLITIASCVAGLIVGFFIALARYFEVRVYISFIRGTPTMVQLVLVYYGIPILLRVMNEAWGTSFDINGIHPVVFAIITLGLNAAAYMSEIIRSALMSVDEGQVEACYSLNMTKWQALISVVIPQAFVVALPSLGNNFISLLKETSLVFNIAVVDIMAQARIVGARSYRYFEVYIAVSLIYWVCCMLLERLLAKIETYVRRKERRS
mgnify:CR=1 FL=1